MARLPLITEREGLSSEQQEAFDSIVESRGSMIRPFQVLLHAPAFARRAGELGHTIRFESRLDDADRELAILATGRALGCAFVWESHDDVARMAGVRDEAIDVLADGTGKLTNHERVLVDFVQELCDNATVSDSSFARARDLLGESGVVELAATVGYYTMLGFVMSTADAC